LQAAEDRLDDDDLEDNFGDPDFYAYPLRIVSIPTLGRVTCNVNLDVAVAVNPHHWTMSNHFGDAPGYTCDVDVFVEHQALFGVVLTKPDVIDDDDEPVWGDWPSAGDKWSPTFRLVPDDQQLYTHHFTLRDFCPLRDRLLREIQVSIGVRCSRPSYPDLYACSSPFNVVRDAVLVEPPLNCPVFPNTLSSTVSLSTDENVAVPAFTMGSEDKATAEAIADSFDGYVRPQSVLFDGKAVDSYDFLRLNPSSSGTLVNHVGNRMLWQEFGWPALPDGEYVLSFFTKRSGLTDINGVRISVLNTPDLVCTPVALAGYLALRSYTTEVDSTVADAGMLALPQCVRTSSTDGMVRLRRVVLVDEERVHLSVYATSKLAVFLQGRTDELPVPTSTDDAHLLGITVRGTHTASDWVTNANLFFTECAEIGLACGDSDLHRGFAKEYAEIQSILRALWSRLRSRPNPANNLVSILVAGHSQGGSIASLLAYDALTHDSASLESDAGVEFFGVTFGAARVGWSSYIDKFEAVLGGRWLSVEAAGDAVPATPPLYRENVNIADIPCDGWDPLTCHNIQRYFVTASSSAAIAARSDITWPAWLRLSAAPDTPSTFASLRTGGEEEGQGVAESSSKTTLIAVIASSVAFLCCVGVCVGLALLLVARRRRGRTVVSPLSASLSHPGRQSRSRSRVGSSRHIHHGQ
jgi:hypothetical protein